jgi:hypothetical protein
VPEDLDAALRKEAKREDLSLNQVVLRKLSQAVGKTLPCKKRDLSFSRDGWNSDSDFKAALAEQRQIDPDLWK